MALPNAYSQYNNSKILTASPAELTLMLYDGAIKFCNIAIMGIEQNDINKAHTNIRKVEREQKWFQICSLSFFCAICQMIVKYAENVTEMLKNIE